MANEVDPLLREFLEYQAEERAKGITLESLYRLAQDLANAQARDRQAFVKALAEIRDDNKRRDRDHESFAERVELTERRQDRHANRIGALEGKVVELAEHAPHVETWKPDPREITGTFAFHQIMAEHEERKSDARWLKRKGIEWGAAAIGALMLATLSAAGAWLLAKLTTAPPAPQQQTPPNNGGK